MIYHAEKWARQLKRFYSRNRFIVWLFGMPKSSDKDHKRGLIMLQIDGLSHTQLRRALDNGTMPFLQKLLSSEHYNLHSLYSGVPSSTPAVQGELFYGVRCCVPAFRFKRPQDPRPFHMLDGNVAAEVEEQLREQGQALLTGGSSYSNLFTGGAAESSFCAPSIGWDAIIPGRNAPKMLIFALLNIYSFVRVLGLVVMEFLLAVIDFVRGVVGGRNLLKELIFVPMRVGTSILLRELVTICIKLDAARGLPIIHANFLGYDEQSHRRGPESKFAHWSLRGIDDAVSRIWKSAKRSEYRDYDLWIYSDHGQEATRSYPVDFERGIDTAVYETVARYTETPLSDSGTSVVVADEIMGSERIKLLGYKRLSKWFSNKEQTQQTASGNVDVAAMGPLGFVYIENQVILEQKLDMAKSLVEDFSVPMTMVADRDTDGDRIAHVYYRGYRKQLPADKIDVFGAGHPFLEDVCMDTINVCHHEYAGQLVLFGWAAGQAAMTFRIENGSHAGPGDNETHAFALLPEDTHFLSRERPYLRFIDLHKSARQIVGGEGAEVEAALDAKADEWRRDAFNVLKPEGCLRVMTYNVHSCIGMDGKMSPRRIARVIAMYDPDIIALQEIDVDRPKSMHVDQTTLLAAELNMDIHYHPVHCIEEEQFGNAVLSRHDMRLIDASALSTNTSPFRQRFAALRQPRGALYVEVDFNGTKLNIVNTHLGLTPEERRTQIQDLLGEPRFSAERTPTIVCGDFNAAPNQYAYLEVKKKLNDVQVEFKRSKRVPRKTFPCRYPTLRIDHMFVDPQVAVKNVLVPSNHLTKVASDHLPLIADLDISELLD